MRKRQLGRSDLDIALLVLGGNVFGWIADVYSSWGPGLSGGESETVIGQWLVRTGADIAEPH